MSQEALGNKIYATETFLCPTGKINPETGNEFYDLRIRSQTKSFQLTDIFSDTVENRIFEYFNEAAQHCNTDHPLVFEHLKHVVPDELWNELWPKIISPWKQSFGANFWSNGQIHGGMLLDRQVAEEKNAMALLVCEEDSGFKEMRVIYLHPKYLDVKNLPDAADIRFQSENGDYIYDSEHTHMERWRIHRSIAKILNAQDTEWIGQASTFSYPTGKILDIPQPTH